MKANIADPLSDTSQSQVAECLGNLAATNCSIAICFTFCLHKLLWQHKCGKILI